MALLISFCIPGIICIAEGEDGDHIRSCAKNDDYKGYDKCFRGTLPTEESPTDDGDDDNNDDDKKKSGIKAILQDVKRSLGDVAQTLWKYIHSNGFIHSQNDECICKKNRSV